MDITEASIMHHVAVVMLLLWALSSFNCCHPMVYFLSLIYLYLVHERYVMRLMRKIQFGERRQSGQRRVLSDSETVRWLNHAVEKIWPICMEQIVSQKILLPMVPWFLEKYKPWTVKEAVVQHLYMGRSPPVITEMRVARESNEDDHVVLELGINFRTADDMNAIVAAKLRKRLGFGMWTKLHLMGMHIEGKVLVGVKFLPRWPFLGRLRICFAEPPYFQMVVKPMFTHGVDVTEVPGIAGWIDKLLATVFEQTLVEPNMLVVDMDKFVSPQPESESWFSVDLKEPIAHAIVEVIEATDMKPSDLINGLADPYVKVHLGQDRFRTKTQWKTLSPKWHEEFKIPICTWESPNALTMEVRDKDRFVDDLLGDCAINLNDLRDGQRHDMWLPLQNIKMGRLHLAITVVEVNPKGTDEPCGEEMLNNEYKRDSSASDTGEKVSPLPGSLEKSRKVADKFEPIDIEGQRETGIWVHRPGSEVVKIWEPRKGKSRHLDTQIHREVGDSFGTSVHGSRVDDDSSSTDESLEHNKEPSRNPVRRGLRKIGSVFKRSPRPEDNSNGLEVLIPSPHPNLTAVNEKEIGVKFTLDDEHLAASSSDNTPREEGKESPEGGRALENPSKGNAKKVAKSILKHAGKSCHGIKHAFSRKGSRNFKGESELIERDISVESESSVEESLPSPGNDTLIVEPISVVSNPISGCDNESLKSEDLEVEKIPTDPGMNSADAITKDNSEALQKISDDPSNDNGLVEVVSNPKLSEGNMKIDT